MSASHSRSEVDPRQGYFSGLVRPTQRIVQKGREIGFDDVDFTPRYRDLLRKIVDNVWANCTPTDGPPQLESPTTLNNARTIV
jgi:hypothetical protein